ncbi:DNA-binding protein [Leptospira weilii]|nr:DNA-binding protein [Leptospira weilii]
MTRSAFPGHRGKWSMSELKNLRKFYGAGDVIRRIAEKLSRSTFSIQHKIDELELGNRRVLWTKHEESRLLKYFYKKLTNQEISTILNRTPSAVGGRLLFLGKKRKDVNAWTLHQRENFWKPNELKLLKKLVREGKSGKELSQIFGRPIGGIFNKMRELSLKIKPKSKIENNLYRRFYNVNDTYFSLIDSQKKAYYLGWLITDGWVNGIIRNKDKVYKSNKIGLKIKIEDVDVLEDFKRELETDSPIKYFKKSPPQLLKNKITGKTSIIKAGRQVGLEVYSYQMQLDLSNYGVVPKKTYTVSFPKKLPEKYYPGFIAGVISGDGCVYLHKKHKRGSLLQCNIAGNLGLLKVIRKILIKNIGFNTDKKILKCNSSVNLYLLNLSQTETVKLYYWLKKNNISLMDRKNKIIEAYLNGLE